ncbi:hypothetical protein Btru_002355 [Bulinus truncatus]|nr:hypothetical protein Btru_002355 [Bulinus truncatus]
MLLCDVDTDGGGWIVILRRFERTTQFNQTWFLYKHGFGPICSDFWIGNKYIHRIISTGSYELRIDMIHDHNQYYAHYRNFSIGDELSGYTLNVNGYTGTAGDDFQILNNTRFSTPDRPNYGPNMDVYCASNYQAGWWFNSCQNSVLTGHFNPRSGNLHGVIWRSLTGSTTNLFGVEMKIRKIVT